jgi:hypothetical protein
MTIYTLPAAQIENAIEGAGLSRTNLTLVRAILFARGYVSGGVVRK